MVADRVEERMSITPERRLLHCRLRRLTERVGVSVRGL